ncbi:uncharacterized protein LOC126840962 [Adelges cooleyi]|uniref:uncharacterized protein LOC126840962 n=1 Tax=Adelges cooleyi TaxID=133065 RepID=UPI00217FB0FA|nr:uncharacterized protein LOC126840962 [Adelges cooleyi]
MMMSVQVLFVSSLLLSVFFGTSDCEMKLEEGDIAVFFDPEQTRMNCVKIHGNNRNLGVGQLVEKMSPGHPDYRQFVGKAKPDGTYSNADSDEIWRIIDNYYTSLFFPLIIK